MGETDAPRVFVSFARESPEHVERVRRLYELLRANGIDARADFSAQEAPQDWALWTEHQMRDCDRVLVVPSTEYRRRFDDLERSDSGYGVRYEARLIRRDVYDDQRASVERILIVLLPGVDDGDIPTLFSSSITRYRIDRLTSDGAERLLRVLTGQPEYTEPPLLPRVVFPAAASTKTVMLSLVVERSDGRMDAAGALRVVAGACAEAEVTELDLGFDPTATHADLPLISSRRTPLGRWLRAMHEHIDAERGALRARIGLALHPDDPDAPDLARQLSTGEAGRALHATPDGELVVIVSSSFLGLVRDRTVRFPPETAFRESRTDIRDGPRCWVAVASQATCPEIPEREDGDPPTKARSNVDEDDERLTGDHYQITVHRADRLHIGPTFKGSRRRN